MFFSPLSRPLQWLLSRFASLSASFSSSPTALSALFSAALRAFERFAAELSATSLSPRVMLAYGHSGSSAAMKYTHNRTMQLDGMLALLGTLNAKGALPAGISRPELLACIAARNADPR